MTAVLEPAAGARELAGKGIWADLTPPELLDARRLGRVRRRLLVAVAAVLALLAVGYGLAALRGDRAAAQLAAEQQRTGQLRAQARQYPMVTGIRSATAQVSGQLAQLMATDADTGRLLGSVRAALPPTMTLTQLTLTLDSTASGTGAAADATGSAAGAAGSLDTSGRPHVGTVSISGTARRPADVAAYVTALGALPGVVDVVPLTDQAAGRNYTFTVSVALTDRVLSHRWDVPTPGASPRPGASSGIAGTGSR